MIQEALVGGAGHWVWWPIGPCELPTPCPSRRSRARTKPERGSARPAICSAQVPAEGQGSWRQTALKQPVQHRPRPPLQPARPDCKSLVTHPPRTLTVRLEEGQADPAQHPQHRHPADRAHPRFVFVQTDIKPLMTHRLDAPLKPAQQQPLRRVQPIQASRGRGWGQGTPAQQRQPTALIFGHLPELLAHHCGVLKIMLDTDQRIPPKPFLLGDQAHLQVVEHLLFRGIGQT